MYSQQQQRQAPDHGYDNKHAALAAATSHIAAPQPGYAIPQMQRPPPVAQGGQPMVQVPPQLQIQSSMRGYENASPAPSTPHPLDNPITPIQASFARPPKQKEIKFEKGGIIRGVSEENLLPGRGEKGDDFWRRFSMVAKEEAVTPRESSWLKKTQTGTSSLSKWVWIIGVLLLLLAGGGGGLAYYVTRNNPDNVRTEAIGGGENQFATESSVMPKGTGITTPHVSPTHTVARRDDLAPVPTHLSVDDARRLHSAASRRKNRTLH